MPALPSSRFKVLVAVFLVIAVTAGGLITYRFWNARGESMTTAQLTEAAKRTAPEDRQAWLRLARGVLAAERVQAVASPVEPIYNRGEASRVELGHLLFFDPILSGDKTTACASCHRPERGMADGLPKSVGHEGRSLPRNTPSIFNVAFSPLLFWDGSAGSLEEQALSPLFGEGEMNQASAAELLKRLRAVQKYRELFGKAFGFKTTQEGSEISIPNLARAIAAFERKLNIVETNYDYFVKGQDDKLNTEQLRGLVIFFGQGQCNACHTAPKFHDDVLSSIGTPKTAEKGASLDDDPGFGAVIRRPDGFGMFKTPTLRNVARTAPYMHNGGFKTLEEVIEFYNDGGGRGRGIDAYSQDAKVMKLNLSQQQRRDLVAFLQSLDDLAPPVQPPASVPSGLLVGGR